MKKNIFIITISGFMIAWIFCTIEKASGKESKIKNTLTLEKIETLSSPESQEVSPCIKGKGYCFRDGIPYDGLKLKN